MKKSLVLPLFALSFLVNTAFAAQAPQSGTSKTSVESKLGMPQSKTKAVGEPPISSWEYPQFIVYFEYDHVIHSVTKMKNSGKKKQTQ